MSASQQALGVPPALYLPQWFQTVFMYSQDSELAARVLDMLIVFGIEALFRVGLALLCFAGGM